MGNQPSSRFGSTIQLLEQFPVIALSPAGESSAPSGPRYFHPRGSHVPGGRKIQTICVLPLPQPRIHACIWLSLDSRRGRFCGTMPVPCFVATERRGKLPLWTACAKDQRSTGAQSFARQHSSGYQSCAFPDVTRHALLAAKIRNAPVRDT